MMSSTVNKRKQCSTSCEETKEVERVDDSKSHRSKEIYLKMLQDALDSITDKQAYVEAKKRGLVEKESDPMSFLEAESWNAPASAKRLVAYWEQRQRTFGPVEDSLSLKLVADQGPFNDGVIVMIPDGENRAVLCIDESRRKLVFSKEARLQCAFYLLSQLATIQQREVTILLILRSVTFEFSGATDLIRLIREAFPIRCQAVHIACLADKESLLQETVLPSLIGTLGRFPKLIPKVHIGESQDELIRQLKAAHFTEKLLPVTIGGSWEYTRFEEWQKERLAIEADSKLPPRKRSKVSSPIEDAVTPSKTTQDAKPGGDLPMLFKSPKKVDTDNATLSFDLAGTQSKARAGLDNSAASLLEKKEVSEHSSNTDKASCDTHEDDKQVHDDTKRPAVPHTSEHEKDKNARADCSASSCTSDGPSNSEQKQAPAVADDDEAKQAMLRKRNAIYSKRKYYKKKLEVERLEQSRYELETRNCQLRRENRRLEAFLADAQEKVALQESMEALAVTRHPSAQPLALISQIQSLRNMDQSLVPSWAQLAPGSVPQPTSSPTRTTSCGVERPTEADQPKSTHECPLNQALMRSLLEQRQNELIRRELRERAEALQRSSQREQLRRDLASGLPPVSAGNILDPLQGMNVSDIAAILSQHQQQQQQGRQQWQRPPLNSSNSIQAQLSLLLSGANQSLSSELLAAAAAAADNNSLSTSSLQGPLAGREGQQQPRPSRTTSGGGGGSNQALLEFLARSRQSGNPKNF